jgi:hypothetical protein
MGKFGAQDDDYLGIGLHIIMNTRSWNWMTNFINSFGDNIRITKFFKILLLIYIYIYIK